MTTGHRSPQANARWPTSNVVVLTEHIRPGQIEALESEPVDLATWYETARASGR